MWDVKQKLLQFNNYYSNKFSIIARAGPPCFKESCNLIFQKFYCLREFKTAFEALEFKLKVVQFNSYFYESNNKKCLTFV